MRFLPRDPKQALRCARVLMAAVAYLLWMVVAGYLHAVGLLRIDLESLLAYYAVIFLINAGMLLVVRGGLNLRFADPSLTFVQILVAIICAMVLMAFVVPDARGLMLLLFMSAFFFGIFKLRTHQFLLLALFAVSLYAALIFWDAQFLERRQLQVELARLLVLAAVLLWMSFMGGYVARLRAELRGAMRKIEHLAHTDDLTGTENRRSITAALRDAIEAAGSAGAMLSVCLLDIDRFKRINDEHGHLVGDEVLMGFVQRVGAELRDRDMAGMGRWPGALGRFGGEEFLVVLPGTDAEGAARAAERLRRAVSGAPFGTEAGPVRATVSGGVAQWRDGQDEVQLLRRADRALYRAKERGRDRISVAQDER